VCDCRGNSCSSSPYKFSPFLDPPLSRINEAFFHFDPDKDGYISVEDLVVVMMTKGAKMNQQEATEFAREVDFDNDGHVYYPEVADYLLSGE